MFDTEKPNDVIKTIWYIPLLVFIFLAAVVFCL